jgi:hypothetical protein
MNSSKLMFDTRQNWSIRQLANRLATRGQLTNPTR